MDGNRTIKSGDSDDFINSYNQVNLQPNITIPSTSNKIITKPAGRPIGSFNAWLVEESPSVCRIRQASGSPPMKKVPPRVLEALPSYSVDVSPS